MKRLVIYGLILTMIALYLAGCGRKGSDFSFVSDDTVWGNGQETSETSTRRRTARSTPKAQPS